MKKPSRLYLGLMILTGTVLFGDSGFSAAATAKDRKAQPAKPSASTDSRPQADQIEALSGLSLEKQSKLAREIRRLIGKEDFLGARVAVRKLAKARPGSSLWLQVRKNLHGSPRIGLDIVHFWENQQPDEPSRRRLSAIDELIAEGAAQLQAGSFTKAFSDLQDAAKRINRSRLAGNDQNTALYYEILHLMSQALYGMGRFADALKVNMWLPPTYPKYKQVLFERTWTAFRAGKLDVANGAIASQYSSYYGFIEPELFLLQIYIYRKMCRDDDYRVAIRNLNRFRRKLETNQLEMMDWLKSNPQTKAYLQILNPYSYPSSSFVSNAERDAERGRLGDRLSAQFDQQKKRLLLEIKRVIAFASLALTTTEKEFPRAAKLPPPQQLSQSGLEFWPVSDAEDWLDEIGNHYFIGESHCSTR